MSDRRDTYDRKVQLTGGTTYTVSLPKTWAKSRSIEPGDRIRLHPRDGRLLLTRPETESSRETVTVSAARHDPAGIERIVVAAYVAGASVVRVGGAPGRDARAAVRDAVGGLIGIEVAEETDAEMVARTMLDIDDLPPERTLARIEDRTLAMHEEAVAAALAGDGAAGRRVSDQDDGVDRLFRLLAREFQRSLSGVSGGANGGLTAFDHYAVARQLERVADHAEKIATAAVTIEESAPDPIAVDVDRLAADARTVVERAFSEVLAECDPRTLGGIVADANAVIEGTKRVDRELYERGLADGYVLATVLDSVTRTVEYGVNVADAGLRAALRSDGTAVEERP